MCLITGASGRLSSQQGNAQGNDPRREGWGMKIRSLNPDVIDVAARRKFRSMHVRRRESGCWEWKTPDASGYAKFHFSGESHQAHRVGWTIYRGAIPEGMVLDHLCRNTRCVNPDHLEPVTPKVNWERAVESVPGRIRDTGRCQRGHDMSLPEAWYVSTSTGRRYCLECRKERNRESARRHAERKKAGG